jgi:hypothetical protein
MSLTMTTMLCRWCGLSSSEANAALRSSSPQVLHHRRDESAHLLLGNFARLTGDLFAELESRAPRLLRRQQIVNQTCQRLFACLIGQSHVVELSFR